MFVQPYLFFDGRCEEALAFYQKALGARTEVVMRYRDSPEPPPPRGIAAGRNDARRLRQATGRKIGYSDNRTLIPPATENGGTSSHSVSP